MPTNDEALAFARDVAGLVKLLAPFVTVASPGLGAALTIATKIADGAIQNEPKALALYRQIVSGKTPSPADLKSYWADYEHSYQKLHDDIEAKLASMPS